MKKTSNSAKVRKSKSAKGESWTEKFNRIATDGSYVDEIVDFTNDDIASIMKPEGYIPVGGGAKKMVTDSATGDISFSHEYNGPVPLGWRAVPPSHLIGFKGPMGKALRHFGARNFFLGDQINAWLDQNCFINKATSMPGQDAVSAGYSFKFKSGSKKEAQRIEELFHMEHFNLDDTMTTFDHNKRCFGAALMVPCFEEDVDMSVPFADWSQLKGKTFLGWTNIEPYYLAPEFEDGSRELEDPTYKFYMVPNAWNVYGVNTGVSSCVRKIHRSWIFFRRHITTSKIYQPMYKWQGPSIPQMIMERLYSAEVCANESSMLLRSKRSFVMEADLRKIAANPAWARKFLKNCAANSDNWGVRLVPRNSNAKQMDSYLSECMPLTTAQYGILCAEVDIPAPKFMMAQLTGFANSGNYEIKLYSQKERILQKDEFVPIVKQSIRIATACETGKPIEADVNFNDVDVPTVTETAEMMYEEARAQKFIEEAKAFRKGMKGPGSHHGDLEGEISKD